MLSSYRTLSERGANRWPENGPCPAITKNPNANHNAGTTHVHIVTGLRHFRQAPNPKPEAQIRLTKYSSQTRATLECRGIPLRTETSIAAGANTAIITFIERKATTFRARGTDRNSAPPAD